jgi:proteic killer suppression protein
MLDSNRIRTRSLKRLWADGDTSGINDDWLSRIERYLAMLNDASEPSDLDIPGWHFHALKGDRKGQYSPRVPGNWRLVFEWDKDGPHSVTLEDYHGK